LPAKLKEGYEGYNVHLDGYNQLDLLTGKGPSKRHEIIYYEGDNDIASGFPVDSVLRNMETLIKLVREQNPATEFYFISPKPAPRRMHIWDRYVELHEEMKKMEDSYYGVFFVDVASEMFKGGVLREDLFLEDDLHMNEEGYKIWKRVLRENLGLPAMSTDGI
jgi:lysophospholipase L1-like esterase